MRREVRELIIFAAGALISGVSTWFLCKKYYQQRADEEIASVEKAFTERLNELESEKDDALVVARDAIVKGNEYVKNDPGSREFLNNKSTLEGFIKTNGADRTDYTKYFEKNSKETIEVDGVPSEDDDEPIDDVSKGGDSVSLGDIKVVSPYEITYEEYSTIPGWEFKEFYYFKGDGIVVEESDGAEEIVDNYEYLIGDVIENSGFKLDDRRTLYVRNEAISTDFEITKVDGTYGE